MFTSDKPEDLCMANLPTFGSFSWYIQEYIYIYVYIYIILYMDPMEKKPLVMIDVFLMT